MINNDNKIIIVTKIKKWGNSLAIRIPSFVAKELRLRYETTVDLKIEDYNIILSLKSKKKRYSLEKLLSKITPDNIPEKIDFGPPVGKELI